MTDRELLEKSIYWFRVIAEDMERITSGNVTHNAATTRGRAIRAYEFLEKHKNATEQTLNEFSAATNAPAMSNYTQFFDYVAKKLRECEWLLRTGEVTVSDHFVSQLSTDCYFFRHLYELNQDKNYSK